MASTEEDSSIVPAQEPVLFTRWHLLTVALLALGYAGYYFCRSDLSVVMPLLIRDLGQHGIAANVAQVRLGLIASISVLGYAIGKFFWGSMADIFGGRNNFLGGMAGAIVFTLLFAVGGGFPIFTLAWCGNRLFQASGWVGLVKVSSRWFSYSIYGTVMGVLSLSYLFGDAAARETMALLLKAGMGWRGIFFTGAGLLFALLVANFILLKETPQERGLPAPLTNPLNVFADEEGVEGNAHPEKRMGLLAILRPLMASKFFWMVCLLSLGTTLLRETFNLWTPLYFANYVGLTNSDATSRSALFPLFGGISVLLAGFVSDKLGLNGRSLVLFGGLASGTVCLFMLARVPGVADGATNPWIPVGLGGAGGVSAAGAVFVSCRCDVDGLWRSARQRHGCRDHRWRGLSGRGVVWRHDGAGDGALWLAQCVCGAGRDMPADLGGGAGFGDYAAARGAG